MSMQREKLSTQIDSQLLAELRSLANREGRDLQSLIEEAVKKILADHNVIGVRPEVGQAFEDSVRKFPKTYQTLAK